MNQHIIEELVEKYEIPKEYHAALWAAYEAGADEAGADMGFFKAIGVSTDLRLDDPETKEVA